MNAGVLILLFCLHLVFQNIETLIVQSPPPPESFPFGSTWLTKACSSNNECSQTNAECFGNRCLCTPGYYFSVDRDSCQTQCLSLQPDFVEYPLWFIGNNNLNEAAMTLTNCVTWCTASPGCVTIEYNYETGYCFLATVTAQDVWSSWGQAFSNTSYFQRTCA